MSRSEGVPVFRRNTIYEFNTVQFLTSLKHLPLGRHKIDWFRAGLDREVKGKGCSLRGGNTVKLVFVSLLERGLL